jgi:hypothetical protein
MYEYTFVHCAINLAKAGKIDSPSYQTIIHEHAVQGWRLVQILIENPAVIPGEYVIIFERSR